VEGEGYSMVYMLTLSSFYINDSAFTHCHTLFVY